MTPETPVFPTTSVQEDGQRARMVVTLTERSPGEFESQVDSEAVTPVAAASVVNILRGLADDIYGQLVEGLGAEVAFELIHQGARVK